MLNVRFRERTNAWPGFVDLFSNLVIILIFLMIVFLFLWKITSVSSKKAEDTKFAELQQIQQEQAEKIVQMAADNEQAEQLLVAARDVLEIQENEIANQQIQSENYEQQIAVLNEEQVKLANEIAELTSRLRKADEEKEALAKIEQEQTNEILNQASSEISSLQANIEELQQQLKQAEERAKQQDIEYVEMSNRLNKALADKVAELNSLSEYQSEFYKQVKNALGDRTVIQQDGDRFIISSDILFPSGSYKVSKNGKSQLKALANVITDFEDKIPSDIDWIIRVDGHTDNKAVLPGTHGYRNNMQLSLLRATAVIDELVKNGVSKRRLVPTGFGELHPVVLGNDKESLQKNRRIELQLTNK
ncbi:MAG: OmpA family protein [Alphaproteobacteria bacterium]|nr:OmpA family protein [Alphaproteobacteria bacterium]